MEKQVSLTMLKEAISRSMSTIIYHLRPYGLAWNAESVRADLLPAVVKSLKNWQRKGTLQAFVNGVAKNTALKWAHAQINENASAPSDVIPVEEHFIEWSDPLEAIVDEYFYSVLIHAIETTLGERDFRIFYMSAVEGASHDALAAAEGMTPRGIEHINSRSRLVARVIATALTTSGGDSPFEIAKQLVAENSPAWCGQIILGGMKNADTVAEAQAVSIRVARDRFQFARHLLASALTYIRLEREEYDS